MDNVMTGHVASSLNPLVPSPAEWLVTAFALAPILLWIAFVLWLLRQGHMDAGQRLLGLVLATVLPVLGPLMVWWVARRPRESTAPVDGASRN